MVWHLGWGMQLTPPGGAVSLGPAANGLSEW